MLARAALGSSTGRRLGAGIAAAALLGALPAVQSASAFHAQAHVATTLAAGGLWLNRLNQWRANVGLPALNENLTWSAGDYSHSQYMVMNDIVTHYETPGVPYYSPAGDVAAQNSNIEVNSTWTFGDDQAIDWWMAAPFHAMGMMDPRLQTTGFGSFRYVKSGWQAGFTLDTIRGNSFSGGTYPVYFPGNGTSEPLTTYHGGEYPDPLQACPGYGAPSGLPVFVEVGGNINTTAGAVHSFTGNGVPLAHCVIDSSNSAVGSYLKSRGSVVVVPQQPLVTGVRYVVAVTVNGSAYTWSFTVGPFGGTTPPPPPPPPPANWQSLGGVLTSSPDASSWGPNRVDVFVRGANNAMFQNTWNGSSWTGFTSLGGVITSSPDAVSWGSNRIDVFARGQDNGLWHQSWNGSAWSGWQSLGGVITSDPDVASWGPGRLDIFARGQNNGIWHMSWNGSRWSGWDPLGGVFTSDPSAVSWGPNRIDVFGRGTDNGLWHLSWNGSTWSAWQPLGGVLTSGPDASSCASGHLDVFATGNGNGLFQMGFNGSGWTGWMGVPGTGGPWTSDPAAECSPGASSASLFARGTDNALWTVSVPGS
jgi:hypothetical protein